MKKYSMYLGCIVIGLFLGYLLFKAENLSDQEEYTDTIQNSDQLWTCAMHPQVLLPEPGDCPICGMKLIPVSANNDGLSADQFSMTANAIALANIQTTIVGSTGSGEKEHTITLSGKIIENADATATQSAHFNSRIEKLYVTSLGEQVKMGQPIAQVYSPELVTAQQELITAYHLSASHPALYKAVRNKFKNWKIPENQLDEIEKTGKVKTSFTIYAHVAGLVTEIVVNEGAHIMDGHPIFKVSNLSTVWAEFDAYEHQISKLKEHQKIKVKTTAYPDKQLDTKISFIDPVLNTTTRTITIRAELNNKETLLKPGMFVEGTLSGVISIADNSISIPKSAVLWTGKRSIVYVKAENSQAVFEMRDVILGNAENTTYQILSGLRSGEEIVTNGVFTVDATAQIQGKKSMMNTTTAITSHRNQEMMNMNLKMKLPKEFQKEFISVLAFYFPIKEALIASDATSVSMLSEKMAREMKYIKVLSIGDTEKKYLSKSIKALEAMSKNKNMADQRAHFVVFNKSIVALSKNLDAVSNPIYIQKCPMANTNKGASWLSKEKEIRNPYFGEKMLACGSITDTLQTK